MTTPSSTSTTPDLGTALRLADRAWHRAGVRRRDRARLRADVRAEVAAAGAAHDTVATDGTTGVDAVLGDDPAATALEWARARGITDRRLRLLTFVVPALLGGAVAAGSVLMLLADAFASDNPLLGDPGSAAILSVYAGAGILAAAAIIGVGAAILQAQHDTTTGRTARALLVALPVGGIVATVVGAVVADLLDFTVRARTFADTSAVIVAILALTIVAARWWAVNRQRPTSTEWVVSSGR